MKHRYLQNVVSLQLNQDKCTGCGICIEVCPQAVLKLQDRVAIMADRDACMECGACEQNCPFDAITVHAGVGCAAAVMRGILTGGEPDCTCGGDC